MFEWLFKKWTRSQRLPSAPGLFIVPASANDARVAAVLPVKGSEDASRIRGEVALPPRVTRDPDTTDYGPDESVEWVVSIDFPAGCVLARKDIEACYSPGWRKELGFPQIYGCIAQTGRWTYVFAAGVPDGFRGLKIAWPYFDRDQESPINAEAFESRLRETLAQATKLGMQTARPSMTPADAARHAIVITKVHAANSCDAVVVLGAANGRLFSGRDVWDVMLCLGLRWGDMDLFHWDNPSDVGGDHLFSVSTSTPPGYFLPERIAAGEVQVRDLVFSFSIPRSPAPTAVADAMIRCALYAQKRLGGELLGESGDGFEADELMRLVEVVSASLVKAGFTPGTGPTLQLF